MTLSIPQPRPEVFANVAGRDYLRFREDDHPNYARVAEFLEFDKQDLSRLADVGKKRVALRAESIPPELKQRIEEIAQIVNLVAEFFEGDLNKTHSWFITRNPMLGNVSPRDMLRMGRFGRLKAFIVESKYRAGWGETEKAVAEA